MRRRSPTTRALAVVVIALGVAGCTSSDEPEEPDPTEATEAGDGRDQPIVGVAPDFEVVELDESSSYAESLCSLPIMELAGDDDPLGKLADAIRDLPAETPAESNEREELARRLDRLAENPPPLPDPPEAIDLAGTEDLNVIVDILEARC